MTWIDEGKTGEPKTYDNKIEVLNLIKSLLIQDKELLKSYDINTISDDDLFEIGYNHFSISSIN